MTIKKPKLKQEINSQITNITLSLKDVEFKESDRGDFIVAKIGEYEVIVQDKFVHENQPTDKNPKGSYNIGIKNNFKYPIYKTDSMVKGLDLKNYYFEMHEYNNAVAEEKTKTPKSTSTKKETSK